MTYECHITADRDDAFKVEVIGQSLGWKFSKIDGDPLLGQKVFCYLTRHAKEFVTMREQMDAAAHALVEAGVQIIRKKIEHIVYDTKTGVGV